MELVITMLNGDAHSLHVQPGMTLLALKSLVCQDFDIPVAKQRLLSDNGQKICLSDDAKLLSSYGLVSGSKVWVLVTEPAPFQVFLKNEKGQTHTYEVLPDETVSQFKVKVQRKEGVPADQQRLIHSGRQMEDGQTLESYGVKAESTIFLTLRLRGG